jgi:hypothetical protein
MSMNLRAATCLLLALLASVPALARNTGDGRAADLFFIERNKNRNLVQYTFRLDPECNAADDTPVGAFWRMLEEGPDATESVGVLERRAYGIASQVPETDGWSVRLKALPSRTVTIRTRAADGRCQVEAYTAIRGRPARLRSIYVYADESSLIPSVVYIDIRGESPDGAPVSERVEASDR